eukprot:TRINITY_DN3444_c0_g3_i1.p1 TRINITY_DN3444_c0_g3~~TRINITY_DN3444_c0_g3_i1.p1  ORF type:complete len:334 (+),score=24.71 TRINITY_DN3444_c0_g3_i1:55-1056(+)
MSFLPSYNTALDQHAQRSQIFNRIESVQDFLKEREEMSKCYICGSFVSYSDLSQHYAVCAQYLGEYMALKEISDRNPERRWSVGASYLLLELVDRYSENETRVALLSVCKYLLQYFTRSTTWLKIYVDIDSLVGPVDHLSRFRNVKSLDLRCCSGPMLERVLYRDGEFLMKKLEQINLSYSKIKVEMLQMILNSCSTLKILDISFCKLLGTDQLESVIAENPHVTFVEQVECLRCFKKINIHEDTDDICIFHACNGDNNDIIIRNNVLKGLQGFIYPCCQQKCQSFHGTEESQKHGCKHKKGHFFLREQTKLQKPCLIICLYALNNAQSKQRC